MTYFMMGFFMLAAFVYAGIGSFSFQVGARIFPLVIVAIGIPVTAIAIWQEYRADQRARAALAGIEADAAPAEGTDEDSGAPDDAPSRQALPHFLHISLFLVLLLTIGFPLAAGLYTFAFITLSTWKQKGNRALLQGAVLGALAYAMGIGFRLISAGNLQ